MICALNTTVKKLMGSISGDKSLTTLEELKGFQAGIERKLMASEKEIEFYEQNDTEGKLMELDEKAVNIRLDVKTKGHKKDWKSNVYGQVKSWIDEGLKARAVTRDLDWGIPVPLNGYEKISRIPPPG